MRALIILALVYTSLVDTLPVNAQRTTSRLKFGITHTTFSGNLASGETTWEGVSGIAGGVATELRFVKGFGIVGELLYLRMGAKTQLNQLPQKLSSRSSYLSVPILIQYQFESSGVLQPRFFFGGAGLFLLESVVIVESTTDQQIFIEDDDSIKSFDFGIVTGAGVDFFLASQRLMFEIRYYQGRKDVTKPNSTTGSSSILNNRGWAIVAGVLF